MRLLAFIVAAPLLAACSSSDPGPTPAPADPQASRAIMGWNDRWALEIQAATVDPIDAAAIRDRLAKIEASLAGLPASRPFAEDAANDRLPEEVRRAQAELAALRDADWTPETRQARFLDLKKTCWGCHDRLVAGATLHSVGATPGAHPSIVRLTSKPSADACGSCHADVLAEWRETLHATAWTDPVYRMSAGSPPKLECRSCHSMMPVLLEPLSVGYEWRPRFRPYNQDDSVSCVVCHLRPDGSVAAKADGDAPCRPEADARLASPELCGACHNPSHNAFYEWRASEAYKAGVDCAACHTRPIERRRPDGTVRPGVDHRWSGGNDPEFVRGALRASARAEGRRVALTIRNLCGHALPGEVPSRSLVVAVEARDASGAVVFSREERLKRPFKTETGVADTRLAAEESRDWTWDLPPESATAAVSVHWQPSPLVTRAAWLELGRWEFHLP